MLSFRRLQRGHLAQVLAWRSSPHVTRYMNTDIVPSYQDQVRWFEKLDPCYYWVIYSEERPIGLINLADLDFRNCRTSFGFYIGDRDYWPIGGFVLPYFYNHVFERFPVNKIIAEVFSENEHVIRIHQKHGYRTVGTFTSHIYKNDRFHDITVLELFKKTWQDNVKMQRYSAEFK